MSNAYLPPKRIEPYGDIGRLHAKTYKPGTQSLHKRLIPKIKPVNFALAKTRVQGKEGSGGPKEVEKELALSSSAESLDALKTPPSSPEGKTSNISAGTSPLSLSDSSAIMNKIVDVSSVEIAPAEIARRIAIYQREVYQYHLGLFDKVLGEVLDSPTADDTLSSLVLT